MAVLFVDSGTYNISGKTRIIYNKVVDCQTVDTLRRRLKHFLDISIVFCVYFIFLWTLKFFLPRPR